MSYPIVEFEHERIALIEPSQVIKPKDVPLYCVPCFFADVLENVVAERSARVVVPNRWEDGPHPLYEIEHRGERLAFYQPGIGSGLSAGLLEEVIAFGCRKFVACGGCGVLDKAVEFGQIVCVTAAVRDEGASYHYLPPSREVTANAAVVTAIMDLLSARGVPHVAGKTWTTDAPYRETPGRIAKRKSEGCVTVDMEAAAMIAVAEFRGVDYGHVMYGGDDLSGPEWNNRDWQSRSKIRESLFWLCADAVLSL